MERRCIGLAGASTGYSTFSPYLPLDASANQGLSADDSSAVMTHDILSIGRPRHHRKPSQGMQYLRRPMDLLRTTSADVKLSSPHMQPTTVASHHTPKSASPRKCTHTVRKHTLTLYDPIAMLFTESERVGAMLLRVALWTCPGTRRWPTTLHHKLGFCYTVAPSRTAASLA